MPDAPPITQPIPPPANGCGPAVAGLTIRAREPEDWQDIAALLDLPKVRWGTLRLPFTSKDQWRKALANPSDEMTGIVAELDHRIVGSGGIVRYKGRRSHAADVAIAVHDDFCGRSIGSALMAALVDMSDNWLDLKRLELTVYVDNEPAIRLYRKFGFEVEGTRRADAFRDGRFVDSLAMARLRPGWSVRP